MKIITDPWLITDALLEFGYCLHHHPKTAGDCIIDFELLGIKYKGQNLYSANVSKITIDDKKSLITITPSNESFEEVQIDYKKDSWFAVNIKTLMVMNEPDVIKFIILCARFCWELIDKPNQCVTRTLQISNDSKHWYDVMYPNLLDIAEVPEGGTFFCGAKNGMGLNIAFRKQETNDLKFEYLKNGSIKISYKWTGKEYNGRGICTQYNDVLNKEYVHYVRLIEKKVETETSIINPMTGKIVKVLGGNKPSKNVKCHYSYRHSLFPFE